MRPPRDAPSSEGYPRPQQAWQCGLSDEGPPCALGPSGWGRCPAAAACHPLRDGDRWICNRSALRGGPCDAGPGPDGSCATVQRCTPLRSLRSRRRRFAVGCLVAMLGAACMAFSGSWRNELIVPGPLSTHHAHLATGANATMRCAQCHDGANGTIGEWLGLASITTTSAAVVPAVSQSDLCMKCHEASISPALANSAHNLPPQELLKPGPRAGERDPTAAIACAACHREHQGRMHDLTAMTNDACQACHQEQYHSFAQGHPDFGLWPYERRTPIAFNHASHLQKHFPAGQREFACATCHEADANGVHQLTRIYATSCGACHDKSLAVSVAKGVPLLSLPTLDLATLTDAGAEVTSWPEDADGDFDGGIPPFAKLLITADTIAAAALESLGAQFDYYDVDPDDEKKLANAAAIARALKTLIDDLATRGDATIAERLTAVLGREPSTTEVAALSAHLSPQTAREYRDRWFSRAETGTENEEAASESVPSGTWFEDQPSLSLRYQPAGHADPWLHAWLDALAAAATGPRAAVAEPLLRAALRPTAPGQCGSCHSIERTSAGALAIQWRPADADSSRTASDHGLTFFSHAPHVLQVQLNDCTACHQMAPAATTGTATTAGYTTDDPRQFVAEFAAMSKAACATCHTPSAAGASCTQCHRYHAESGQRAMGGRQ